jgi:pectate lyase
MKLASVRTRMKLLAAATVTFGAISAYAVPVVPGVAGYGIETPAGRGGTVHKVINLNTSGTGSLRACIDATGPRVCVFEVSGTIRLTSDLTIRNNNITIAGQTAPSPGIMIRGAALKIQASEVLVQHLRIRVGDDANGPDPANRDALKIEGSDSRPVRNVVIDHCSFSWAIDEIASVWGTYDNITLSNNIFAEPLNESIHPTDDGSGLERHGYGVILGSSASGGRVTMTGNLFAHVVERNPLSRARELVFVNNVVYNRANMDVDLQSSSSRQTRSSIVGNVFLRGPSYVRTTRPIYVRTNGTYTLSSSSRVHQSGNHAPESGSTAAQLLQFTGSELSGLMVTSAPVWNTGLTAIATANNGVYDRVLRNAGARPTDRDSVDKRIVNSVRNRNGQVINCVTPNGTTRCNRNAGGWPTLRQNTRRLTTPASPSTVNTSGYSNLDNWLNSIDASLRGVVPANSPASPPAVSVQ